ncbi:MAG: hypothetical protein KKC03_01690 [Bacteroidetes bacterium]|nr:hypothetical protein [Bacteroidota bacterium]
MLRFIIQIYAFLFFSISMLAQVGEYNPIDSLENKTKKLDYVFKPKKEADVATNLFTLKKETPVQLSKKIFFDNTTERLNKSVLGNNSNLVGNKMPAESKIKLMRSDFISLIVYSLNGDLKRYKRFLKSVRRDEDILTFKNYYYAGYFRKEYGIEEDLLEQFLFYCADKEEFNSFLKPDFDEMKLREFFSKTSKEFIVMHKVSQKNQY